MTYTFTGKCVCGHSWDDHHHGMVLNPKFIDDYRVVDGCLGEECEATQLHGVVIKTPECHCPTYWDIGWGIYEDG